MKIAVTGHKGRLGSELIKQGCIPITEYVEVDITDGEALDQAIAEVNPDVIINCAAFTDVDACETKEGYAKAIQVNFWGVENLKKSFDGGIIHISTDYVFDGKGGSYTEEKDYDNHPVNSYGLTKMTGEMIFLAPYWHGNTLVRTTGLYGRGEQHDLVKLVRSMLSQGNPLPVSKNLMGNQTYIPHFAEALINIANRPDDFYNVPILNIASQEVISRYEFALMVASVFGLDKKLLLPVTNKYISGWVAERPTKGGLKVNLARKMKVPIYSILDGLKELRDEEKR